MLAIILLPVLLAGVVRIGFIQDAIVHKVATYFSNELDTEISINSLYFNYSGEVVLKDFLLYDQQGNKIAAFDKLKVKLNKFQQKKRRINLGNIVISGAEIYYSQIDSTRSNIDFIVDYFSTDEPPSGDTYNIYCDRFSIENSLLRYSGYISKEINEINLRNLNVAVRNVLITQDSIGALLNEMNFSSAELFTLKHLEMNAGFSDHRISIQEMKLQTMQSNASLSLQLKMDSLSQLSKPFKNDISIKALVNSLAVIPSEFSSLYGNLDMLQDTVFLSGNITGTLKRLKLKDFEFKALPYASFNGEAILEDPGKIADANMDMDITSAYVNPRKMGKLIAVFSGNPVKLPTQVYNLEYIRASGHLRGKTDDFYAGAVFTTAAGDIITDLDVKQQPHNKKYKYKGNLKARNFNLAKVMGSDVFGYIGFSAFVDGTGLDKYAKADMKVTIDSAMINRRWYRNVQINGLYDKLSFDGNVDIVSQQLQAYIKGRVDFSQNEPQYTAEINVPVADIKAIGLIDDESRKMPVLSTNIKMQLAGSNFDNLQGFVIVNDTRWKEKEDEVIMEQLVLNILSDKEKHHRISLESDFADFTAEGKFNFADLADDLGYLIQNEFPAVADKTVRNRIVKQHQDNERFIDFELKLHNTDNLTSVFFPDIRLASGANIEGRIMIDQQKINLNGRMNFLNAGMVRINDITVNDLDNKKMGLQLLAQRIQVNDTLGIDNFSFKTFVSSDTLPFYIDWDDKSQKDINKGDISGVIYLDELPLKKLRFDQSYFTTNDTLWKIKDNAIIEVDSAYVAIKNFRLGNDYQSIKLNGVMSADSSDEMTINFHKLDVSNIDPFTNSRKIDFDGMISGNLSARNIFTKNPTFISDLSIDSIGFNHEHLGDALITSGWVDSVNGLFAKVEIRYRGNIGVSYPLKVEGFYYPNDKEENFDFDLTLQNFKLKTIAGYLEAFTSDFRGLASGNMHFEGNMEDPELLGEVKLMRTYMKVDYLNTRYSFTDYVKFNNNEIVFENVGINDNNSAATSGNKAYLSGRIFHNNFKEIQLDLTVNADKFTVLNTSYADNDMFYGSAIATGKVKIYGPTHDVSIDVFAKTEKGTRVFIPLTSSSQAAQNDFITFISSHQDTLKQISFEQERKENVKGVKINIDLETTPDAEVQIIFDQSVGDVLKARGSGQLELNVDTRGDFSMYGNYRLTKGDYLFSLENIINKPFDIKEGGTITWAGDPFDARLNIDAVYRTEARLYDLISYIDSSAMYKKPRNVNCVIHLKGNLSSPEITPDIELPNADEITRQLLRTVLYVNANQVNQQEMNRQFVGLLVLNSFFPPADIGGGPGGNAMDYSGFGATSSTELLSSQLSNWLSQISDDFNVGVNYRMGDDISTEQLEIALSTQLFNEKVSINTNVGVGGNEVTDQAVKGEETSNIVGDVNVEYKINEKIKLRAFNQHNNESYLDEQGPYTQGIGVFYRKEFDRFIDLFKKQKDKDQKQPKEKNKNKSKAVKEEQEQIPVKME